MVEQDASRRQVVVLFTDADDRNSVIAPDRLLAIAEKSGSTVFVAFSGRTGALKGTLTDVARITGGKTLDSNDIAGALGQIRSSLEQSYVLVYSPEGVSPAGWHAINVLIAKPGKFEVRGRRGYWRQ
jgi:hypothetical protein